MRYFIGKEKFTDQSDNIHQCKIVIKTTFTYQTEHINESEILIKAKFTDPEHNDFRL